MQATPHSLNHSLTHSLTHSPSDRGGELGGVVQEARVPGENASRGRPRKRHARRVAEHHQVTQDPAAGGEVEHLVARRFYGVHDARGQRQLAPAQGAVRREGQPCDGPTLRPVPRDAHDRGRRRRRRRHGLGPRGVGNQR